MFPVLDCISYSCARNRSRLSLWLGLAVDISQFWNVYRTVGKKDFMFITRVRVSLSISSFGLYIIQLRKKEIEALAVVRVSRFFFRFGRYIVEYARRTSCFSLGLGLAVRISNFGLYIIQLCKKEIVALAVVRFSNGYFTVLECISYSTQEGLHVSH